MFELPAKYGELNPNDKKKVREQYSELQNGLCYFCGKPLTEQPHQTILEAKINPKLYPPNFFKFPVHLHHSHETGLTIGTVHNRCNAYLWEFHNE